MTKESPLDGILEAIHDLVNMVSDDFARLNIRADAIDARLDKMDDRFDRMDCRFYEVGLHIGNLERTTQKILETQRTRANNVIEIYAILMRTEGKLDATQTKLHTT